MSDGTDVGKPWKLRFWLIAMAGLVAPYPQAMQGPIGDIVAERFLRHLP